MKIADEFGFPLYDVMKEMFNRVGQDIDKFDFSPYETQADEVGSNKPILCNAFEWTVKEEADFREWFVDFFYSNAKARKASYCYISKSRKFIRDRVWPLFSLDYSWKYKKEIEGGNIE